MVFIWFVRVGWDIVSILRNKDADGFQDLIPACRSNLWLVDDENLLMINLHIISYFLNTMIWKIRGHLFKYDYMY